MQFIIHDNTRKFLKRFNKYVYHSKLIISQQRYDKKNTFFICLYLIQNNKIIIDNEK
jgi:hypothetical protein